MVPKSYQPPRTTLTGIHLADRHARTRRCTHTQMHAHADARTHASPGRTPSHGNWPETTETNLVTLKLEAASYMAELFSGVRLPYCSLPRAPTPHPHEVSCFLSMCVSWNNSFPTVRQEPTLGPWKGVPLSAT